jgi:hypothetical protein
MNPHDLDARDLELALKAIAEATKEVEFMGGAAIIPNVTHPKSRLAYSVDIDIFPLR